jgi:hypothetical protein
MRSADPALKIYVASKPVQILVSQQPAIRRLPGPHMHPRYRLRIRRNRCPDLHPQKLSSCSNFAYGFPATRSQYLPTPSQSPAFVASATYPSGRTTHSPPS